MDDHMARSKFVPGADATSQAQEDALSEDAPRLEEGRVSANTSLERPFQTNTIDVSRATFSSAHSRKEDAGAETFEIEITDLPPTRHSHYLLLKLKQWRARWESFRLARGRKTTSISPALRRKRVRSAFTILGISAALLVLLLGNLAALRTQLVHFTQTQPTPGATPAGRFVFSSMPIIVNRPDLETPSASQDSPGALPATCPQISTLQYFTTPLDPPGLGASPIWLSGFTGPSAALDRLSPIDAQVAHAPWPGGWYETVAVFIQKGYSGDITLRGDSQENGAPVWLSKDNPQILGTQLVLNLNDGSHFIANGQWKMTSITIAVPHAGCYALQASWSGSLWTRFFAAGS